MVLPLLIESHVRIAVENAEAGRTVRISHRLWSCAMQKENSSNSSARPLTSTTRSARKRRSAKATRKPGNFAIWRRVGRATLLVTGDNNRGLQHR
jgi:hypothetical protein